MKKLNGEWGIETQYPDIKGVFSECDQDVWVVETLDGMENGYFIDIGCSVPWMWNNTALLEAKYGWSGIGIDESFENNIYVPLSKERGIEHDWKSRQIQFVLQIPPLRLIIKSCLMNTMFQR